MKVASILLKVASILSLTVLLGHALFAIVAMWGSDGWLDLDHAFIRATCSALAAIVLIPVSLFLASYLCPKQRMTPADSRSPSQFGATHLVDSDLYPDEYKSNSIAEFRYNSPLKLMRLKERLPCIGPEQQYIVAEDYTVCFRLNGDEKRITVPKGMLTDLASVPRSFRWYVGRVGPHLEATIVHDYLYVAWQLNSGNGPKPKRMRNMRLFADELMLEAMKQAGLRCKAYLIHRAIRCFGGRRFADGNSDLHILNLDRVLSLSQQ